MSPLVIADLTKRYGRGPAVLDGLSVTFQPGAVTALLGPNGSGKTTLLRLLTAQAFPTAGSVRYGESDIHQHPHRWLRHVGVVHDQNALPGYLSAVELLEWVLRARGGRGEGAPQRIERLLDSVRLDERRHQLIGTYSSGMTKKAQWAAALVAEPEVLLMDEPFRGLDTASTEAARDLLRRHRERGGLALVSTHLAALGDLADATLELGE